MIESYYYWIYFTFIFLGGTERKKHRRNENWALTFSWTSPELDLTCAETTGELHVKPSVCILSRRSGRERYVCFALLWKVILQLPVRVIVQIRGAKKKVCQGHRCTNACYEPRQTLHVDIGLFVLFLGYFICSFLKISYHLTCTCAETTGSQLNWTSGNCM